MPDWLVNAFGPEYLPEARHVTRVVAAMILGGLIGLERDLRDKPAGFRTIILICLGACVFSIISESVSGANVDRSRIAAQIVSGIGFLGAGAVLRDRRTVYGLTTAATIWAVAAIGMATGFGYLALALLGTAAILVSLFLFDFVERFIGGFRDIREYRIVAPNTQGVFDRISALFTEAKLRPKHRSCHEEESSLVFHITAMGAKKNHQKLLATLAHSKEYELRRG